jgi:hypothetical protein
LRCTDFAPNCTPFRASFCVHVLIGSLARRTPLRKLVDFFDGSGGRTRDRTLDLSRVKRSHVQACEPSLG